MNLIKTIVLLAVMVSASAQLSAQNNMIHRGLGDEIHQNARIAGVCDDISDAAKLDECATKEFSKRLFSTLKYPADARENGIQGTVIVGFSVGKDGRITDPFVKKDIGADCGNACIEALLAIDAKFIPAKNKSGEAISSVIEMPVSFTLN